MTFTLYRYTCRANGKGYIGVTSNPDVRKYSHARGKSGAKAFNRAVKKHGIEQFEYAVLAVFDDVNAARYHEQSAITHLGTLSPSGYNLRAGAPYTLYAGAMCKESRDQQANAIRGRKNPNMSAAAKARKYWTPEQKAKITAAQRNRTVSEETRAKQSAAQRKRFSNPEQRAQMSAAKKIVARNVSQETRQKLSISTKLAWARRKLQATK